MFCAIILQFVECFDRPKRGIMHVAVWRKIATVMIVVVAFDLLVVAPESKMLAVMIAVVTSIIAVVIIVNDSMQHRHRRQLARGQYRGRVTTRR